MVNVDVETLSGTDHPVCAFIRGLRGIFLMAQPPLLSEEGNTLAQQFIHTFHRPPLQFCLPLRRFQAIELSKNKHRIQEESEDETQSPAVPVTAGSVSRDSTGAGPSLEERMSGWECKPDRAQPVRK